jgi:hypothetical protein
MKRPKGILCDTPCGLLRQSLQVMLAMVTLSYGTQEIVKKHRKRAARTIHNIERCAILSKLLIIIAILSLLISASVMVVISISQQYEKLWIRLLTVAVLPAPLLALCMGSLSFIVTGSRETGILVFIAGCLLAMLVALPTEKFILFLWNLLKRFVTK